MKKVLFAILAVIAVVFFPLSSASAHNDQFASVPADGAVVSEVSEIQFTFGEAVATEFPPETVLSQNGGGGIELGAPAFDVTNTVMTVPIVSGALPDGLYTAATQIVSIDGHTASYQFTFTVSGSPVGQATPEPTPLPISEPTDEEAIAVTTTSAENNGPGIEFALASIAGLVIVGVGVLAVYAIRKQRNKPGNS